MDEEAIKSCLSKPSFFRDQQIMTQGDGGRLALLRVILVSLLLFNAGFVVTFILGVIIGLSCGVGPDHAEGGVYVLAGCIANIVLALPILIFGKSKFRRIYFYSSLSGLYLLAFMLLRGLWLSFFY